MKTSCLSLCFSVFITLVVSVPSWAIFNGAPAKTQDELAQSVVFVKLGMATSLCTGTLIEGRYVLTAAHCIKSLMTFYISKPKEIQNYKINVRELNKSVLELKKSKVTMHPKALENHVNGTKAIPGPMGSISFVEIDFLDYRAHDIAIIELEDESVEELKKHSIKGLDLNSLELREDQLEINKDIDVYGFGLSEQFDGLSSPKNISELRTKKMQSIQESFEANQNYWTFKDQGTAGGDSGGPLFLNNKLIGLVSAGELTDFKTRVVLKSFFTKLQSRSTTDYILSSIKDFEGFQKQQCEKLKVKTLEAVSKATSETSQIQEITNSYASCRLYENLCFAGGAFFRDPVLGPCQKASRAYSSRFIKALEAQK